MHPRLSCSGSRCVLRNLRRYEPCVASATAPAASVCVLATLTCRFRLQQRQQHTRTQRAPSGCCRRCSSWSYGRVDAPSAAYSSLHGAHLRRDLPRRRWNSTLPVSSSSSIPTATGLFSIPELQAPTDFAVLTQRAIKECNSLRSTIAVTTASHALSALHDASLLLHQLDDISKTVCNVIDAAELCRSVHADPAWREAANHAYTVLSDYIGLLNADTTLYQALRMVQSSHNSALYAKLSEEERRFIALLQAEFERDGIHLPDAQRQMVRQLQNRITDLESSFSYNLVHSRHEFSVDNVNAVTDVIPEHVLQQYGIVVEPAATATQSLPLQQSSSGKMLRLGDSDSSILQTLLKYSPDADLRRTIHWHSVTATPENINVLAALVQARHEMAVTQGFCSYVERSVPDKMARSAAAINAFLQQAAAQNAAQFQAEMAALSRAKEQVQGDAVIQPWDTSYYVGLLSARNGDLRQELSQYFTVSHTLQSMQLLVDKLFGIVMKEEPMSAMEQWDVVAAAAADAQASTSKVQSTLHKYSFSMEDTQQPLGIMYLDLHPREAKYGHAAHFTVRCGCAINYNDSLADGNAAASGDDYQCPIVALVCNLSTRTVLSHSEVETLFHEFGHALHSLLSRTKFQHMSGTRAAMDFVETPSHLFENFVWDGPFLQLLGQHYSTGQAIPDAMIEQLRSTRYEFAALERQNQVLHSMFDQQLFGALPVHHSSDTNAIAASSQALFERLHDTYNIPFVKGSHWYSRFGHLVSYGAGYYGYLYAQGFARQIWNQCLEGHSLDRTRGRTIWQKLLVHGGARDPHTMLTDVLGRPP